MPPSAICLPISPLPPRRSAAVPWALPLACTRSLTPSWCSMVPSQPSSRLLLRLCRSCSWYSFRLWGCPLGLYIKNWLIGAILGLVIGIYIIGGSGSDGLKCSCAQWAREYQSSCNSLVVELSVAIAQARVRFSVAAFLLPPNAPICTCQLLLILLPVPYSIDLAAAYLLQHSHPPRMLDSSELQQLKIQALAHPPSTRPSACFVQLSPLLTPGSKHVFIRDGCNGNVLAFGYVMLGQVFGGEGKGRSDGLGRSEAKRKLDRINEFLLSQRVNLAQVDNMPTNMQAVLREYFRKDSKNNNRSLINLYLKKMLLQFFKALQQSTASCPIGQCLSTYPIAQPLLCLLLRCILFHQYQISDALDYSRPLPDHTVYTALCDAFYYSSLKIEDHYTEIVPGTVIRVLRVRDDQYYMVSVPEGRRDAHGGRREAGDTFRKSSSEGSTPGRQGSSGAKEARDESADENNPETSEKDRMEQNSKRVEKSPFFKTKVMVPEQAPTGEKNRQSEGYTSVEILNQLNPKVKQSMLRNITYFKTMQS